MMSTRQETTNSDLNDIILTVTYPQHNLPLRGQNKTKTAY